MYNTQAAETAVGQAYQRIIAAFPPMTVITSDVREVIRDELRELWRKADDAIT